MKATQINPINVSISLIYCVFGILSFLVLKIVSRYFQHHIKREIEVQKGKITEEDMRRVNFSKIFIKSFFMKTTLIGSIINVDKKNLLRELFVLSSIVINCFHINSYILWPSAVGTGVFIATIAISQVLIPLLMDEKSNKVLVHQCQNSSIKNKPSSIDSNSIQIEHNELQFPVKNEIKKQNQNLTRSEKAQLLFILILTVITQILLCQSILTLSLSISNSGILNLVSFGLSVAIDQLALRIVIGLVGYLICFALFKTQSVNFYQNHLFVSFCYDHLAQEIKNIHSQRIIQEMQHKITSINNPEIHFSESVHERIINSHDESHFNQNATVMKIIPQFFQEPSEEMCSEIHVVVSEVLPIGGLLEEDPQFEVQEEKVSQTIQQVQEQEQSAQQQETKEIEQLQQVYEISYSPKIQQAQRIPQIPEVPVMNEDTKIDTKSETNYFQLFQHDLSMFDDTKANYEVKLAPIKKMKKKFPKPQPKFKRDPFLYFPYEEHKLSNKESLQKQHKENSQNQTIISRDISTIDQNFMNTISITDCTEISVVKEEPEISLVLQQKNTNMKNLVVNPKPMVISTQRPLTKKINENLHNMRKVSPYYVTLSSEISNPKKTKKIHVSKKNKENGNQTNKSFMISEAINSSRTTQKDTLAFTTINNNFSTINS